MTDSTEPLSSSFFFLDEEGVVCFSIAELVVTYSGSSGYSGGSNYNGGSDFDGDFDFDGISDYHCSSGRFELSDPMSCLSFVMNTYDIYAGIIEANLINISQFFGALGAFPTALSNYYTGNPIDLTYDINNLGLNFLSEEILAQIKGRKVNIGETVFVNLSSPSMLGVAICNTNSAYDMACYASTASAIGGITFTKVGEHQYQIKSHDTYNFDWKKGEGHLLRNIGTVLGKIINEGICIKMDDLVLGPLGVILGFIRRNVTGTTEFKINFTGTLTVN